MKEYKVSIIIPVYNVERYIERCLESVFNQTFKNSEVIIVNDGSTDKSMDIVKHYKEKCLIINQENSGLSSARNKGLEYATGDFILFIDSDDYIHPSMVKDMYDVIVSTQSDIVICGYQSVKENEEIIDNKSDIKVECISSLEAVKLFFLNEITGHAWNKMAKKQLYLENNISYPVGQYYEDMPVTFDLLVNSEKISIIDKKYYYYVVRENSITQKINLKKIEDHFSIFKYIENKLENASKISYFKYYKMYLINQLFYNFKVFKKIKDSSSEDYSLHKAAIEDKLKKLSLKDFFLISGIRIKLRVKFILLMIYKMF